MRIALKWDDCFYFMTVEMIKSNSKACWVVVTEWHHLRQLNSAPNIGLCNHLFYSDFWISPVFCPYNCFNFMETKSQNQTSIFFILGWLGINCMFENPFLKLSVSWFISPNTLSSHMDSVPLFHLNKFLLKCSYNSRDSTFLIINNTSYLMFL